MQTEPVLARRTFLVGGVASVGAAAGGLLAVEEGWLPGRIALRRALGRCDVDARVPLLPLGALQFDSFESTYRQRTVTWAVALPPDRTAEGLPAVLVLHGRGGNSRTAFDSLAMHHFLAEHVADGGAPFVLVGVDGGERYWHPRSDGDDPLGMVVHEVFPRLQELGVRTDEIAVTGWSMGGYGALLLARESERDSLDGTRVTAAAALSPALFPSYEEAAGGAFDDPEDFATWGDLIADPGVQTDTALFVACGDTDAFTDATERYRAAVEPTPLGAIERGCHDAGYWRSQCAEQLAFLAAHLPG